MNKLVETKLQKIVLLIGGLLIFLRLLNVNYYERYNAILTSIGIAVFTFVFLIILQDFHPKVYIKAHIKVIKRILSFITLVVILVIIFFLLSNINWQYFSFDRDECIREVAVKYANKQANSIDFNSYIKDTEPEKIDLISKIFAADENKLIEAYQNDWNLIKEINKKDILFIYNNPRWMENNLTKVGDLIKNRTISETYIKELIEKFKNNKEIINSYCKPSIFKFSNRTIIFRSSPSSFVSN
jgi:uncharacterized protein (DUF486 family)